MDTRVAATRWVDASMDGWPEHDIDRIVSMYDEQGDYWTQADGRREPPTGLRR